MFTFFASSLATQHMLRKQPYNLFMSIHRGQLDWSLAPRPVLRMDVRPMPLLVCASRSCVTSNFPSNAAPCNGVAYSLFLTSTSAGPVGGSRCQNIRKMMLHVAVSRECVACATSHAMGSDHRSPKHRRRCNLGVTADGL